MENLDFTENKIKIDEIKQNIIKEPSKRTNIDIKDREQLRKWKWQE